MTTTVYISIFTMGGLALLLALFLSFADKKLRVEEDPLIEKIYKELPGANCGACGYNGCYDFAVNLVAGNTGANGCPVGGKQTTELLSEILGLEVGENIELIPRILCCGGNAEATKKRISYSGPSGCSVKNLVSGGEKLCVYGCLGGGDCIEACPFGAIFMNENGLPEVIEELCTGCGICAEVCPRDVIEMHPIDRKTFVFCKNHDDPKTAKNSCSSACIGCGICVRKSEGGIILDDNLAKINYSKFDESKIPYEKCPTNALRKIR